MQNAQRVDNIMPFDTLYYAKRLEATGVSAEQAEVQVEMLRDLMEEKLCNKHDLQEVENNLVLRIAALDNETVLRLKELENEMKVQFKEADTKLVTEIKQLDNKLENKFKELDNKMESRFKEADTKLETAVMQLDTKAELLRRDLKIWMGGMSASVVGILAGLQVVLSHLHP